MILFLLKASSASKSLLSLSSESVIRLVLRCGACFEGYTSLHMQILFHCVVQLVVAIICALHKFMRVNTLGVGHQLIVRRFFFP